MVLTKREKYIVWITLALIVFLLADRVLVSPWLNHRRAISEEKEFLLDELERARILEARQEQFLPAWQAVVGETMHRDRAAAESQILHAVRGWAREAGLTLASIRPERIIEHEQMEEMVFQLSGQGSMATVVEFLFQLESSTLPVRVGELQLSTRTEGRDDLVLQLKLSTLVTVADDSLTP